MTNTKAPRCNHCGKRIPVKRRRLVEITPFCTLKCHRQHTRDELYGHLYAPETSLKRIGT